MSITRFFTIILFLESICVSVKCQERNSWTPKNIPIPTKWTKDVNPSDVLSEYPRPMLFRKSNWINLNGLWEYCIADTQSVEKAISFDGKILVPYPVESSLSGVKRKLQPTQNLWYRRSFVYNRLPVGKKLLLHFGAVDWRATVFLNGKEIMTHKGGYTSFTCDVSPFLKKGMNQLTVKVYDPSDRGVGPHGKQVLNPGNIYYTSTSGIWQTVWLEEVPENFIDRIRITSNIDKQQVVLNVRVNSNNNDFEVLAKAGNQYIAKGPVNKDISIEIPNAHLWSPNDPFLYSLSIKLINRATGRVVDETASYFGMRKVSIGKDLSGNNRIFLNNKYLFNLGVLDQGFWPDGLYTAPTDSALAYDIKIIKAMGFNTIRKHIKVEPERWYYHADRLGVLVWQDFVNPNQSLPNGAKGEFETEMEQTIEQLFNHPCITTWTVFNEKWGQFDQQRLTEKVKMIDPSRLVNGHSGELLYVNNVLRSPSPNAFISSDMADVHSYPYPMLPPKLDGKVRVIGEYGGVGVPLEGQLWDDLVEGWGYQGVGTPDTLKKEYTLMVDSIVKLEKMGLSASIYTQPFDVESEQNGLLTYNRSTIKLPLDTIRRLNERIIAPAPEMLAYLDYIPDIASPTGINYKEMEHNYSGKRDSAFLRRLAIKLSRNKDELAKQSVLEEYFRTVYNPAAEDNIKLIMALTSSTKDTGFSIVKDHLETVNSFLGKNSAENFIMRVIFNSEIKPVLNINRNSNVPWDSLDKVLISKYGELAKERLIASKLLYYNDRKDWMHYGKYYKEYFDNVLKTGRNSLHINNMTWPIFLYVEDRDILNTAIRIMEYNIRMYDHNVAGSIDTYANLLYKIGRRKEALEQEKKAMSISEDDILKRTYEKMVRNEKTWE